MYIKLINNTSFSYNKICIQIYVYLILFFNKHNVLYHIEFTYIQILMKIKLHNLFACSLKSVLI